MRDIITLGRENGLLYMINITPFAYVATTERRAVNYVRASLCKHMQGVAYSLLSIYRSHNDSNIIFK